MKWQMILEEAYIKVYYNFCFAFRYYTEVSKKDNIFFQKKQLKNQV